MSMLMLAGTEQSVSPDTYEMPTVDLGTADHLARNEAFWAPLAFVLAYWGSAWAWCWAVCWGRPRSCDVKWWGAVRAECG